jgi:uncharacterized protein YegL
MSMRRLPVYLLLDCSGSMFGEKIEAVRQGVKALVADLQTDPQALETAYLSVITFESYAKQVVPLTELMSFKEPRLEASGATSLGEALTLLENCIAREVKKTTESQKGDWKPMIFLMTDGIPTDNWEEAANRLKLSKPGNIIACAAGADADTAVLKKITEIVLELNILQPDAFKQFFRWVSSSIKATSTAVSQVSGDSPVNLPPMPPTITYIP